MWIKQSLIEQMSLNALYHKKVRIHLKSQPFIWRINMKAALTFLLLSVVYSSEYAACWSATQTFLTTPAPTSHSEITAKAESIALECETVLNELQAISSAVNQDWLNLINFLNVFPTALQIFSDYDPAYLAFSVSAFLQSVYGTLTSYSIIPNDDVFNCYISGANLIGTVWSVNQNQNPPLYTVGAVLDFQNMEAVCSSSSLSLFKSALESVEPQQESRLKINVIPQKLDCQMNWALTVFSGLNYLISLSTYTHSAAVLNFLNWYTNVLSIQSSC